MLIIIADRFERASNARDEPSAEEASASGALFEAADGGSNGSNSSCHEDKMW